MAGRRPLNKVAWPRAKDPAFGGAHGSRSARSIRCSSARCSGVDLRKPLSARRSAAIDAGMDRYAVLVFHDQNITDDQQMAFTQNFGEIENAKRRQHHQAE